MKGKRLTLEEKAERSWFLYGQKHCGSKPYPDLDAYKIGWFAGRRSIQREYSKDVEVDQAVMKRLDALADFIEDEKFELG